jgi:hypothetical protein
MAIPRHPTTTVLVWSPAFARASMPFPLGAVHARQRSLILDFLHPLALDQGFDVRLDNCEQAFLSVSTTARPCLSGALSLAHAALKLDNKPPRPLHNSSSHAIRT